MILLLLILISAAGAIAGLVKLWRRRRPAALAGSIAGLLAVAICAFTAEDWYDWFGFGRGDGQVFIGYYLIGLAALGAAALAFFLGVLALALRPSIIGDKA